MPTIKTIHHGGIEHDGHVIKHFSEPSRQKLMYELNSWFFDMLYASGRDIVQLPPLDDWNHSAENTTYWSFTFLDEWHVWITHEIMEFE